MTVTQAATPVAGPDALLRVAAGQPAGTLVSVTRPVAAPDPLALHAAGTGLGASLWLQPEQGFALVALGEAWATRPGGGAGRFAAASAEWSALLSAGRVDVSGAPRGSGPLLLGGFSFDDHPGDSSVWPGFEPACLVLPSLLLTQTPAGSWLTVSWLHEVAPGPERLLRTWVDLVAAARRGPPASPPTSLRLASERPDVAAWHDSVARLAGAVGRGRLDKAVLARRITLAAGTDIDVPAVLRRLAASAPESTIFAIRRGARTFLGATPERLVSLEGPELRTMAMAGSIRRGADTGADDALAAELLASDKEREEHGVVVAMLRDSLAPLTEQLEVPARPEVVRLRHVQHLVSVVSGRLREVADILALVERLHPTPAVGGMPRELALELIAEEEPIERGWYAGPLGWIDRHGDGEFVVALRSGVVAGREATLFAGCGIVADSDPHREWDESAAKLLALGSALGIIEP